MMAKAYLWEVALVPRACRQKMGFMLTRLKGCSGSLRLVDEKGPCAHLGGRWLRLFVPRGRKRVRVLTHVEGSTDSSSEKVRVLAHCGKRFCSRSVGRRLWFFVSR